MWRCSRCGPCRSDGDRAWLVTIAVAVGVIAVGIQHAFAASPDRFTAWDWGTATKFGVPFALGAAVAAAGLLDRWRVVLVAVAIAAARAHVGIVDLPGQSDARDGGHRARRPGPGP